MAKKKRQNRQAERAKRRRERQLARAREQLDIAVEMGELSPEEADAKYEKAKIDPAFLKILLDVLFQFLRKWLEGIL